jgi:hypothetical protein
MSTIDSQHRSIDISPPGRMFSRMLSAALCKESHVAEDLAEELIAAIQGAIVASRALNDPAIFGRTLSRLEARIKVG